MKIINRLFKIFTYISLVMLIGCEADNSSGEDHSSQGTPIAGHEVRSHDLTRRVNFISPLKAFEQIEIKSRIDGTLESLYFEEGDIVEKGDLLASIDVAEMEAQYNRATAELDWIEGRYKRKQPLFERGAVVQAEIEALEAELNKAKNEVALWDVRVNHGKIYAPRSGIITEVHVRKGGSISNQDLIFKLSDISSFILELKISDKNIIHLKNGDPVNITLDAYPEKTFTGEIKRIYPYQATGGFSSIAEILLEAPGEEFDLRPGFISRVQLNVESMEDVIAIPTPALLASEGDDVFVYVVEDDQLIKREVSRGPSRQNLTVINDGLNKGEVIVGTNPTNLRENIKVRITQWVE